MESILQKRGTRLALLVLVCAGALYGAYQLSAIFAPLLFSFIMAYVLDPIADALERRKLTRLAAVIVIFGVGTLVIATFLTVSGFYLSKGVVQLVEDVRGDRVYPPGSDVRPEMVQPVPDHFESLEGWSYFDENENGKFDFGYLKQAEAALARFAKEQEKGQSPEENLSGLQPYISSARSWLREKQVELRETDQEYIDQLVKERLDKLYNAPVKFFFGSDESEEPPMVVIGESKEEKKSGPSFFGRIFTWFSWLLLCPLYIFYLLLEIDPLIAKARSLIPGKQRPRVERIVGKIDQTMAAFFRGRLTICFVKGAGTSMGLLILGVPFALPLGLAAGFLALIPYVGIWFAIIPSLILAWLDSSGSIGYILGVASVFIVMEVLEGFVMIPKFLGKEVGLHPLTVIVTMLVFAELLGFVGVLLSVPLAAIAKILLEEFVMPLVEEFAAETPDADKAETTG